MATLFAFVLLLPTVVLCDDRPNILFLLTDDQDVTANSLNYMPYLGKLLRQEGMEFANYFVPTGLCCPSRSTIIRGQYCHNTKIYDNGDLNNSTYLSGGFPKVDAEGLENSTVATLLSAAGYQTALVGKYLNGYEDADVSHVPQGWDLWMGMTTPPKYFGPHFSVDGKFYAVPEIVYQTDFIRDWALDFLAERRDPAKPFFLYIAPWAPHAPATPAPRHANLFDDYKAPRNPSFNPDDKLQKMKPSWIGQLPALDSTQIALIDEFYRNRLRALQAVDEMLLSIVDTLKELGIDNNTYLFYSSDNGQHLGDYRLPAGKRQAYDTDVLVPFLVRGPGIKVGVNVTEVVQSVDLLPTWLELAQAKGPLDPKQIDGKSIVPLLKGSMPPSPKVNQFRSAALVEYFGLSQASFSGSQYTHLPLYWNHHFYNNTFHGIRVINGTDWAEGANWLYVEWCTTEREFYNLTATPHEVYNTVNSTDPKLIGQLSQLLSQLAVCAGDQCHMTQLQFDARAMMSASENRLKCHNPPDKPSSRTLVPGHAL